MAHQHYKGTGQMHSFRGLLADGGQDRIRIEGATGDIAWRITKFNLFDDAPGTVSRESIVKIYREHQSSVDGLVKFTDDELLAVAYLETHGSPYYTDHEIVIFDNSLFVRNVYLTHSNIDGSASCNYYIELEEVKVSAVGMAQLAVAAARRT